VQRHWVVVLATVFGLAPVQARDAGLPVGVLLTTSPDLPPGARQVLIDEAGAIWRRAGVRLTWADGDTEDAIHHIRVLVVHRNTATHDGTWPVGELVSTRSTGRRSPPASVPVAFVSLEGARQVLATAALGPEPERLAQHRLGVVLGRAVAHEIGHVLLGTPSHAASGLMRARIDAVSFADLRAGGFFLDREAATWFRAIWASPGARGVAHPRFSYPTR
jgi:hypothetical protein